ncbi:MAG: hypothetical protein ABIE42_09025 [Candidatus Eisenbacteria bacterium]
MTSVFEAIRARFGSVSRKGLRRRLRNERGITMPDIIIAMAVSSLVIAAGVTFYMGVLRSSRGTTSLAGLQRDAAFGMEIITRDIREGSSVTVVPGSVAGSDSLSIYYQVGGVDSLLERYYIDAQGRLTNRSGTALVSNADSLRVTHAGNMVNVELYLRDSMGSPQSVSDDQTLQMVGTAACRNN